MSAKEQQTNSPLCSNSGEGIDTDTVYSALKSTVESKQGKLNATAPCFTPSFGVQSSSSSGTSGSMGTSKVPQGGDPLHTRLSSCTDRHPKTRVNHGKSQGSGSSSNGNGRHDRKPGGAGQGESRGGGRGRGRGGGGGRSGRGRNGYGEDGRNEMIEPDFRRGVEEEAFGYSNDIGTRRSERKYSFGSDLGSGTERPNVVVGEGEDKAKVFIDEDSPQELGERRQHRVPKGKRRAASGGNGNHLLNFQFQPLHGHQQSTGGRSSEGGRSRRGNGAGRGAAPIRGPISKEQFLQANFHFILNGQTFGAGGDASLALQEAFFDPDVLVDWDTVDTVGLSRRVPRRKRVVPVSDTSCSDSTVAADSHGDRSPPPPQPPPPPPPSGQQVRQALEVVTLGSCSPEQARSDAKGEIPHVVWGSAKRRVSPILDAGKASRERLLRDTYIRGGDRMGSSNAAGDDGDGDGDDDDDWRCSICLQSPRLPRITKCGHGPFCLVCILRHLKGDVAARCPLCFEMMHRITHHPPSERFFTRKRFCSSCSRPGSQARQ